MNHQVPSFLKTAQSNGANIPARNSRKRLSFIDKTLNSVGKTIKRFYIHSESGNIRSVLSEIHPKIKALVFVFLIVAISLAQTINAQLLSTVYILVLFLLSGVKIKYLCKKILFLSFFFGFLIFLPALLNVVSPGNIVLKLYTFDKSNSFWIYTIPQTIGITDSGMHTVSLLFLRVFNSISLSLIFVYSSSFSKLTHGFRVFFIPDMFLMIMSLTYKFIVILSKTIEDTYLALKSRLFGSTRMKNIRNVISGRILFVFKKAKTNYESTYDAMISRGYNGKVVLSNTNVLRWQDICFLILCGGAGTLIILM